MEDLLMSRPFRRWVEACVLALCPWVMVLEGRAEDKRRCPCGCGQNLEDDGELWGIPIRTLPHEEEITPRRMAADLDVPLEFDGDVQECEQCNGTGALHVAGEPVWQEPCGECSGEGEVCR